MKGIISLFLLLVTTVLSDATDDVECQESASVCALPAAWQWQAKCWVTCWTAEDKDHRRAGERSYCQVTENGRPTPYRCLDGRWVVKGRKEDAVPLRREKRFIRIRLWRRRRRYSPPPPPPNNPPYFTSCPGSKAATADSGLLTASPTWALPAAADPNGHSVSITRVAGQGPGSVFTEGTHSVRYRATDSGGLSADCTFTVTVTVTSCPESQARANGAHRTQSCSGPRPHIYGSVCHHGCNAGYELHGHQALTCRSNGQWDGTFPSCAPVSCGHPGNVVGGDVTCASGFVYGQTCLLHCKAGYSRAGAASVTCQAGAHWDSALGTCTDVEAPSFPAGCPADQSVYSGPLEAPVAVNWVDPHVTDNSGQAVTVTSDVAKGSRLRVGAHSVTVTAEDMAGNQQSCRFAITVQARTCPTLTPPANSDMTCSHGDVEGSKCDVTCHLGYRLTGAASMQCGANSLWDQPLPSCQAIMCPAPTVQHGAWVCSAGFQHPATCGLTCNAGFSAQAPLQITCQHDATWSPTGSCRDVQAPSFVNGCPANIEEIASPLGFDTHVTWNDPDVTDNSQATVTLSSDVISNASLPLGLTTVTYTATDPTGNVATCTFSVNVTALYCAAPSTILVHEDAPSGYTCPNGHVLGAECDVICPASATLVGQPRVTCARDVTLPSTTTWRWDNGGAGKPLCRDDQCPPLAVPRNGWTSCHVDGFGRQCMLGCTEGWDVPLAAPDVYYCPNTLLAWLPTPSVPDCVVRVRPGRVTMMTSVFYIAGTCNASLAAVRDNFIHRLHGSVFKDACANVPSCSAENVKVTCGPVTSYRGRRDVSVHPMAPRLLRHVRASVRDLGVPRDSHVLIVSMTVSMLYEEGKDSSKATYKKYADASQRLLQRLDSEASSGQLTGHVGGSDVTRPRGGLGPSDLRADCPSGTQARGDNSATETFSCVGCGAGWYLGADQSTCKPCKVGSFTPLDAATRCTPCPDTWSTQGTASSSSRLCNVPITEE